MKKHIVLASILTALPLFASAAAPDIGGLGVKIEPIVGYETVYRDTPTAHTTTRTIYGARLAVGKPLLALELEYTKGNDTENYTSPAQVIRNDDEQAKVGLRSNYGLGSYVYFGARAGAQGTRNKREVTVDSVTTATTSERINPYAGASLGVHLGSYLSLTASSTMVIRDINNLQKNDLQNTLSLSVGLR
ncbi:MAG TPA: outer membrane beta-barrel protein [Bdellovibrionales bacterium]|nr:outer membrane beta-barrel protein [Bdellovibrionales bacterium]